MEPFKEIYKKPNVLDRLLGFATPMMVYQEIHNYLASVPDIDSLDNKQIKYIKSKYKLRAFHKYWLNKKLRTAIILYLKYLIYTGQTDKLITHVDRLQQVLEYNGDIFKEMGKAIIKAIIQTSIKDKRLDPEDIKLIEQVSKRSGISEEKITAIYRQIAGKLLEQQLEKAIADGDWSPEEEEQLLILADNLGMKLGFSKEVEEKLERLRFVWKVENDALEPIAVRLNLKQNEVCVFTDEGKLFEWYRRTKSVSVSGPTLSFRVMKGFYLSHGSYSVKRETVEKLEPKDAGEIYLTNQRFIFKGKNQVVSLPYEKILDISVDGNYIYLYKQTGKPIIITISHKPEDFLLILTHYLYRD